MTIRNLFPNFVVPVGIFLMVLFSSKTALGLVDSGEVPSGWSVWSCWYWPYHDDYDPNLYDSGEAMERYDDYDIGASSQTWEYNYHGPPLNPDPWWGHCHAWAAASCWEPQPTTSRHLGTTVFRIRDRKGLVVETYDDCADGTHYELVQDDPSPGLFWRYLRQELRGDDPMHGHGMAFVGELYWGDEVWNYPIYKYRVDATDSAPYSGTMQIWFAQDNQPWYADATNLNYGSLTYSFSGVVGDGTDPIDSGTWIGSGAYHRPDAVWRPYYATTWMQYCTNTELDETHLIHILTCSDEICRGGIDEDCDGLIDGDDPDCAYTAGANAEASTYGRNSLPASGSFNALALLLVPVGAVVALRIRRSKK